jgi:hypothetical protein
MQTRRGWKTYFSIKIAIGIAWLAFMGGSASAATPPVSINPQPPASVGRYDVYEITMNDQTVYSNPWSDVVITVIFTAPSAKKYTVGGFSYDGSHVWKARFAPNEVGNWTWSLTYQVNNNGTSNGTFTTTGNFNVTLLNSNGVVSSGFVRIHPTNKLRLITEGDARLFSPRTIASDRDVEGTTIGTTLQVLQTLAATGFNARSSHNSGSFQTPWPVPWPYGASAAQLQAWDQYVGMVHNSGMKCFLNIFMGGGTFANSTWDTSGTNWTITTQYLQYIINRYGAYVDIWEFMIDTYNFVPSTAGQAALKFIHQNDPYVHPVAMCPCSDGTCPWDIVTGWGYQPTVLNQIDSSTGWKFQSYQQTYGVPYFWTEGGSQGL